MAFGNEEIGLIEKAIGIAVALFGTAMTVLIGFVKSNNTKIRNLEAILATKADNSRMEKLADNLATAFQQQREDKQTLISEMREDKKEITGMLSLLSTQISAQHSTILTELGKRPTRDEVSEIAIATKRMAK